MADDSIVELPIEPLLARTPPRIRQDLGDLQALADDMTRLGQHTPILVTQDSVIVDGERRCRAALLAGRRVILARPLPFYATGDSTGRAREIEISTTLMRQGFSPEERMAAAAWLESRIRDRARARMLAPIQGDNAAQERFPEREDGPDEVGQSRDIIAAAVGFGSGRTYDKARTLRDEAPDLWQQANENYARTGTPKIDGLYKRHRERKRHEEIRQEAAAAVPLAGEWRMENADAMEFMAAIPEGSIDMICTDIPFNLGFYGGASKVGGEFQSFAPGAWDNMDPGEYRTMVGQIVTAFARLLQPSHGALVCFCDRAWVSHLWDLCRTRGLFPRNILHWIKPNPPTNVRGNLDSAVEVAVWATAGSDYVFNRPAGASFPNVITEPLVSGAARQLYPHPTAKPVRVMAHWIRAFSEPGHVVLDPFCGSGATLEAALRERRQAHGNDLDERYARMATARCAAVCDEIGVVVPVATG